MTQENLVALYQQKIAAGIQAITDNRVIPHPYVSPGYREERYAVSAVAFRFEGSVAKLLFQASEQIHKVEPTAYLVPYSDLHII